MVCQGDREARVPAVATAAMTIATAHARRLDPDLRAAADRLIAAHAATYT